MRMLLFLALLIALTVTVLAAAEVDPKLPRIIRSHDQGFPVYAYGDFNVLGVSPTYEPDVVLQNGNNNPAEKIQPKKSWDIQSNLLGLTPTRSPGREQPDRSLNFIDGDPTTLGFAGRPIGDPQITRAWVRIDLPRPMKIHAVGITISADAPPPSVNFEVRTFNWDLWQRDPGGTAETEQKKWKTVYRMEGGKAVAVPTPDNTAPAVFQPTQETDATKLTHTVYRFEPVEAREVWLLCTEDFFLGSVEVYDENDRNVATLMAGAGITVSKQDKLFWLPEATQSALWQMQYDLGIKWLRLSYYLTPLIWTFVEQQRGVYQVDPYLDQLVTQAAENGIEICLTLGPDSHALYAPEERVNAYVNYVRFMVNHFRGRIRYYEILNEFYNQDHYGPNKQGDVEHYIDIYTEVALPAAKAIREVDGDAKIIMCGPCPLVADFILGCLKKGMAPLVDVISWHPYSFQGDTTDEFPPEMLDRPRHVWAPTGMTRYDQAVQYLRDEAGKLGFHGELQANESGAYAIHRDRTSQLIAAKYLARSAVLHTAINVPMFWNETTSLLRPAWQPFWGNHDPSLKPAYSYFMMRTLCTVLDSAQPQPVNFTVRGSDAAMERYSFTLPDEKRLLAVWQPKQSRKLRLDDDPGVTVDVLIDAAAPKTIVGIDLINGLQQPMTFNQQDGKLVVPDLQVRDYPLLLRLEY